MARVEGGDIVSLGSGSNASCLFRCGPMGVRKLVSAPAGPPVGRDDLRIRATVGSRPSRGPFLGHRLLAIGVALLLVGAAWLLVAVNAANGDGGNATFTVDDSPGADCSQAQYTTIQEAVDAAALAPGPQSIYVCPGTYPENVLIGPGNAVEIRGSGTGKTFVTGVAGTAGPIFDATRAGSGSISRLTGDGLSALGGGAVGGLRDDQADGP